MSARLGRNKDAHGTLIEGVGQFIFEKEMNKAKKRERLFPVRSIETGLRGEKTFEQSVRKDAKDFKS